MSFVEPMGYFASALVLATFCMRDMAALRCVAIASNLAFIAYGGLADLGPVLLLHLLLLPMNLTRLRQARDASRRGQITNVATLAETDPHATVKTGGQSRGATPSAHGQRQGSAGRPCQPGPLEKRLESTVRAIVFDSAHVSAAYRARSRLLPRDVSEFRFTSNVEDPTVNLERNERSR